MITLKGLLNGERDGERLQNEKCVDFEFELIEIEINVYFIPCFGSIG